MPRLTVCCPLAAIDCPNDEYFRKKVYDEVTSKIDKETIKSISFYPENWANKLRITLKEIEVKNEIIIEGLCLFGKTVAFEDEGGVLQRLVVTDAHPEWDLDVLKSVFSEYGDIARCEREFYYEDGQKTIIETGKIFVYTTNIRKPIPRRVTIMAENSLHQVNVWYRRQNEAQVAATTGLRCAYCGLDHRAEDCEHKQVVCFFCQESGHEARGCPNNKGCRKDESAFIFFNGKCPLSNWNTEYPFRVGTHEYICVEQYVMEEKAYNFGDSTAAERIRNETNPRIMKNIGKSIRNYDHQEWLDSVEAVTFKALQAKFNDTQARGARDFLLETGERRIGESNTDQYWGTGIHHLDPKALSDWTGRNAMGNMLMEVRRRILKQVNEEKSKEGNSDDTKVEPSDEEDISSDESDATIEGNELDVSDTSFMSLPNPRDVTVATASSTPKAKKPRKGNSPSKRGAKPKWVIALGDSNLPKLIESPDGTIPAKMMCMAKSGMTLQDAPKVAETCMIPKEDVDQVLVHLGTCSWSYNEDISTADVVFKDYEKMLSEVSTVFPSAKLILSGVIMRDTTGQFAAKARLINEEIGNLNKKLKKLGDDQENITFIPNDEILTKEQGGDHYLPDTVHLNPAGAEVLLENLRDGVRLSLHVTGSVEWSTAIGK